jgi:hypothetical protein
VGGWYCELSKESRAESFYRLGGHETECAQLDREFGEDFILLTHRSACTEEDE